MRSLGVCFLVLLVLLLPLRAAWGAAMPCHALLGDGGGPAAVRPVDAVSPCHADAHAEAEADADAHAVNDVCKRCAALCSLTPLPPALAAVPERIDRVLPSPPGRGAPPASFVRGGPERPPRNA